MLSLLLQDTGSSNGTFINNVRLSQTSTESEPYEVSSGDIVQFGVDVMENSRRETHGCIVATLKLFLPDGRETKASQSIGVGGASTKLPPVDLYRLNQYIQEANQREQILETKLTSLQKMVEATKFVGHFYGAPRPLLSEIFIKSGLFYTKSCLMT